MHRRILLGVPVVVVRIDVECWRSCSVAPHFELPHQTQEKAKAQVKEVVMARKQRALVPRGQNATEWLTAISGKVADKRMGCIKTLARADRDAKRHMEYLEELFAKHQHKPKKLVMATVKQATHPSNTLNAPHGVWRCVSKHIVNEKQVSDGSGHPCSTHDQHQHQHVH